MMNKEFRFSNMILSYGENMQIYNDINIEFVNLKMYYMMRRSIYVKNKIGWNNTDGRWICLNA